jgi:serine protease Do
VASGAVAPPVTAAAASFDPAVLGVVFVPDVLDKTPPFIESTRAGSVAVRAGLEPDDLVVAVNGRAVASRSAVREAIGRLLDGDPVRFTVIRAGSIVECELGPKPRAAATP